LRLFAEHCENATMAALYPFNAMRNRALQMVQTQVRLSLQRWVVGKLRAWV
jgi:hypothetical protein